MFVDHTIPYNSTLKRWNICSHSEQDKVSSTLMRKTGRNESERRIEWIESWEYGRNTIRDIQHYSVLCLYIANSSKKNEAPIYAKCRMNNSTECINTNENYSQCVPLIYIYSCTNVVGRQKTTIEWDLLVDAFATSSIRLMRLNLFFRPNLHIPCRSRHVYNTNNKRG